MPHVDGVDDGVGYGVLGRSPDKHGVRGSSGDGVFDPDHSLDVGVYGTSKTGEGVFGDSVSNAGVAGRSKTGYGVYGQNFTNSDGTAGVWGKSDEGKGVAGESTTGTAVYGEADEGKGVFGESAENIGVKGLSGVDPEDPEHPFRAAVGVYGVSSTGEGVFGNSIQNIGVHGSSNTGIGAHGSSNTGIGAQGTSTRIGVRGLGSNRGNGVGIAGISNAFGVIGWGGDFGGYFIGNVNITGSLTKGGGGFRIDHPLDPSNKSLSHSFVESADMKNVYDGVVILDSSGEAVIELPDWFGTLNKHFRYQLTAIGAPGPNLYIAEEISDDITNHSNKTNSRTDNSKSHFKIAGGASDMKVSWQVTGIRDDPYAKAHPIQVEEDKPDKERGYYIHPDLYGQSAEIGISRLLFPEQKSLEQLINENKGT
jgi:hypothetical protein